MSAARFNRRNRTRAHQKKRTGKPHDNMTPDGDWEPPSQIATHTSAQQDAALAGRAVYSQFGPRPAKWWKLRGDLIAVVNSTTSRTKIVAGIVKIFNQP